MFPRHPAALAALLLCVPAFVQAQEIQLNLPAQPLATAITELGERAGLTIVVDMALVNGRDAPPLSGPYSPRSALGALLKGTGLRGEFDGSVVTIRPAPAEVKDNSSSAVQLPNVQVIGVADPREETYRTPGSVAVVTREEIDRLPPRNTSDVLEAVPGVFTSQTRQNPGVAINIRGLQDFGRVNVMIDGARQNFQRSGHGINGQAYVDPELLAGVDISKGPQSTIGGAGQIAGAVNFRTLTANDLIKDGADHGGRINLTSGNNAYHFSGSAAAAWRPKDQLDFTIGVSRKDIGAFERGSHGAGDDVGGLTRGVSRLSGQETTSGLFKTTFRPAAGHEIRLGYVGMNTRFDEGSSIDVEDGTVTSHSKVTSNTFTAGYDWNSELNWLNLNTEAYYTETTDKQDREAADAYGAFRLRYKTRTVGASAQNTAYFKLPGLDAKVRLGGEWYHDWTDPQAQPSADGQSLWFTGATPKGERTVSSGFAEAALTRDDWLELTGGLRYDWYGLKGDGNMYVGSIANAPGVRPTATNLYTHFSVNRSQAAVAPKVSLALKPTQHVQFFASWGKGLRPPAITESLMWGMHTGDSFPYYPNPNLREERSTNWEIGTNLRFDELLTRNDKLRVKAAWFDTRVKNYITQARIMSPISASGESLFGPFAYVNLQHPFHTKGLELQADYDTGDVFAELSYTRTLVDAGKGGYNPYPLGSLVGYPGTPLGVPGNAGLWYVMPPKTKIVASGGVRVLDRKLTLGARFRMTTPNANQSVWLSGSEVYNRTSHVYDAWVAYEASKSTTLRLSVENIFDRNYFEMNGATYWVAPGRTVMGTVSYRF
ncbi:TonB-dependent receptor [Bordetella sp. N]|uniref:TonB-dependent receptor n=1 Tax=Bordetella sp. N TaxID=1746199 RepID=UPI00070C580B|nr:TonB-dependent receptor [Bordetella sp. N]ALM84378.1 hypothetical protein ASB57_16625 [Bordetella sp. N]